MKIVWTASRQTLVHGEPLARPVDAVPEPAHLAQDLAAEALLPLPRLADELPRACSRSGSCPRSRPGAARRGSAPRCWRGPCPAATARRSRASGRAASARPSSSARARGPRCRLPVTFGGGMTIVYGGLSLVGVGGEVAALDPPPVQRLLDLRRRVLGRQVGAGVGRGCHPCILRRSAGRSPLDISDGGRCAPEWDHGAHRDDRAGPDPADGRRTGPGGPGPQHDPRHDQPQPRRRQPGALRGRRLGPRGPIIRTHAAAPRGRVGRRRPGRRWPNCCST